MAKSKEEHIQLLTEKHQNLFLYQPIVLIDQDTMICFGSSINIESSALGNYTYSWDMDDGTIIPTDTIITHPYTNPGIYNIQFTSIVNL